MSVGPVAVTVTLNPPVQVGLVEAYTGPAGPAGATGSTGPVGPSGILATIRGVGVRDHLRCRHATGRRDRLQRSLVYLPEQREHRT
jgi:hypothetical protein